MLFIKDISYMLSHLFFIVFLWVFLAHRYSRLKTFCICLASIILMTVLDVVKLHMFPDSRLCYLIMDLIQIADAQLTGLIISRKRDSQVLFIGLSASNYVIVGSITASILYIFTENVVVALAGNIIMHLAVICLLYFRIGIIVRDLNERVFQKSWLELCLIPVFFFCCFSSIAFFPYTLYENPENILVAVLLMITMLVSYVVILRYVNSESKRVDNYWKNIMLESYVKGLESQHYMTEQSEMNLKVLRHDMRHYSMMIDSLLKQEEYDEVRRIVNHIEEVVDKNRNVRHCSNLILNTILHTMAAQADSFQVALDLDTQIPKEIPVNEYEFALVLANLLENAIYSVRELPKSKRSVTAKIQCTKEHLLIDMENACEKEIIFDTVTGLPKSRRGGDHGLGMQSVLAFSERLGASIDCYCEKGRFRFMMFANF